MKINSKSAHKNYKGDLWPISTRVKVGKDVQDGDIGRTWTHSFPQTLQIHNCLWNNVFWRNLKTEWTEKASIEKDRKEKLRYSLTRNPFPLSKKQTFQPQKLNQEISKYRNFLWGARGLCSILGSPTPGSFKGEMRTLNSHLWKPGGTVFKKNMKL